MTTKKQTDNKEKQITTKRLKTTISGWKWMKNNTK